MSEDPALNLFRLQCALAERFGYVGPFDERLLADLKHPQRRQLLMIAARDGTEQARLIQQIAELISHNFEALAYLIDSCAGALYNQRTKNRRKPYLFIPLSKRNKGGEDGTGQKTVEVDGKAFVIEYVDDSEVREKRDGPG